MNEPFGRQPKPVTICVVNGDLEDKDYWLRELRRYIEGRGHNTERDGVAAYSFRIYPRAVND